MYVETFARTEAMNNVIFYDILSSYVALTKALGYSKDVKALLAEPLYSTMEELDVINKNKNRKRGRNEISK